MSRPALLRWSAPLLLALAALGSAPAPAAETGATPVDRIRVPEGFRVELLYSVPKETEGSWVSLCVDPRGRILLSDQYGGLYRVTPSPLDGSAPTQVEPLRLEIGQAQGMAYAFDSLYVVVANDAYQGRGLYRVRDTDSDDQFDSVELLKAFPNEGGEHGPHAVVPGPDGQSLYLIVGNQTPIPDMDVSRVPRAWGEDLLLPRVYGRGFMRGVLAPRGWIARTDPDGKSWELLATGFRNEYDAAFNRDGELFTFDADMEWDMNTPWYRPTRVCHVVSGAEFGWRNGSGKWPAYYPDSVPPVVNIGPGSPTGVAFGYGARFPSRYQEAFYICDWSYGKLYAVHLQPDGAGYTAEFEEFASAQPLPLTDLAVNPVDGALYVAIGGRRTQSGLYRITYNGPEPTAPPASSPPPHPLAEMRRSLETLHGRPDPAALDAAWPHLDHPDRWIRYAARVAVEHQPAAAWRNQALSEKRPRAAIQALLALARHGGADDRAPALESLSQLDWETLSREDRLDLLRVYGLIFIRLGSPSAAEKEGTLARLNPHFPAGDPDLDIELCQLLVYLQSPDLAPRAVTLLETAPTQEQQIALAKSLSELRAGWNRELQERYFRWFLRAANYKGGMSFGLFVQNIRQAAIDHLPAEEKAALQPVLDAEPEPLPQPYAATPREFVKNWTVADLAPLLGAGLEGNRDYDNGRNAFGAAACYACHRFNQEGGAFGPDLTGVGGRFSPADLLESILEPSKEISDQYGSMLVTRKDGVTFSGRIINLNEETVMLNTNMLDPSAIENIDRRQVDTIAPSPVSMMPPGLLNTLSERDILDLLAYLISGGDRRHPLFR